MKNTKKKKRRKERNYIVVCLRIYKVYIRLTKKDIK